MFGAGGQQQFEDAYRQAAQSQSVDLSRAATLANQAQAEAAKLRALGAAMKEGLAAWNAGDFEPGTLKLPEGLPAPEELRRQIDLRLRGVLTGAMGKALSVFEETSPIYLYRSPGGDHRAAALSEHAALYRELPPCPAAATLHDDATFARPRLTGPTGPFLRAVAKLPEAFKVSDTQLRAATSPADSLVCAGEEGRLFLCDYSGLEQSLQAKSTSDGTPLRLYAPYALFAVPSGGGSLRPVAIQESPRPDEERPSASPIDGWRWTMAKYAVESADLVHFEAVAHLGHTHLLLEPVALATVRHLAPNHPISRLLLPHVEGTLSVNDMAVYHLLADGGAIDQTFAATMESIRSAATAAVIAHDLRGDTLAARLERQGLCNVPLPRRLAAGSRRDLSLGERLRSARLPHRSRARRRPGARRLGPGAWPIRDLGRRYRLRGDRFSRRSDAGAHGAHLHRLGRARRGELPPMDRCWLRPGNERRRLDRRGAGAERSRVVGFDASAGKVGATY